MRCAYGLQRLLVRHKAGLLLILRTLRLCEARLLLTLRTLVRHSTGLLLTLVRHELLGNLVDLLLLGHDLIHRGTLGFEKKLVIDTLRGLCGDIDVRQIK